MQEATLAPGAGGPHTPDMETRIAKLESDVASLRITVEGIKGALDWQKAAFALMIAVVLGVGGWLVVGQRDLSSKLDGIKSAISDEFRAQRADQAAQITAISNAITATKQQAPQIVVLPAQSLSPPPPTKP